MSRRSRPRVCVGVHVYAEPERLRATLASLRAHTLPRADLLLLVDGPDRETADALRALPELAQSWTPSPRGAAACFNRLTESADATVVVLLESGARVGPGWLEHLLVALDADPRNGLAGPSTNRSENEQAIFPSCEGTEREIAATAARAGRRVRHVARRVVPIPNLAPFCYAVRRDVVDAIGEADERYGLAPGWTADFTARAGRAGFAAVWARGAFVYRSRPAARRSDQSASADPPPRARPRPLQRSDPLVSCIMPTRDRADFALQAVRYFERQNYGPRELLIVDDGDDGLAPRLPDDPRIRYVRSAARESVGAKRNRACELARGTIIAHRGDDDWYGPDRLRGQVAPTLAGPAHLTALFAPTFFDLERWTFWSAAPELHRRLFVADVHGGTLVYERRVWEQVARYPNRSLAEDAAFLSRALRRGCRLARLPSDGLFVYVRHARNSWPFICGEHVERGGWRRDAEPALPSDDRAFYASVSVPTPGASRARRPPNRRGRPLVSCIMPTADRRRFAARAIAYFLRQDYPNRELVVVDDGADRIADLIPADERVRYVPLDARLTVGEKRNVACEIAEGTVIAHWDDDDWFAPHRLRYQLAELARRDADICGASRELYYDPARERAWLLEHPAGRRNLAGNTLCYRKAVWERRPFRPLAVGEDVRFLRAATSASVAVVADHRFYVGIIHARNTSPKQTFRGEWTPWPVEDVRALLGADLGFYSPVTDARPSRRSVPARGRDEVAGRVSARPRT